MIILVAVLAILLLIAVVLAFHFKNQAKEMRAHAAKFEKKWVGVSQELIVAKTPELEDAETGNFVRRKSYKRATPETYRNLFDLDADGQRILEHLTTVFCRDAFAPTDRETNYRLGQHSVINFIINNINQANHPNYKEEVND